MVTETTKHFVEFMVFTGRFFDENTVAQVEQRSIQGVEIPEQTYAYRFYSRDVKSTEDGGEVFEKWSDPYNKSGYTFMGGIIRTVDTIPDTPEFSILRDNMRINQWPSVVQTRFGSFRNFDVEKDRIE